MRRRLMFAAGALVLAAAFPQILAVLASIAVVATLVGCGGTIALAGRP